MTTDDDHTEGRQDHAACGPAEARGAPAAGTNRLRRLTRRTPVTSGWASGDAVRRTVRRRRQRRIGGAGAVVALATAGAITLAVTGGGAEHHTSPPVASGRGGSSGADVTVGDRAPGAVQLVARHAPVAAPNAGTTAAVVRSEKSLTVRLLQQTVDASPAGNTSVSPYSLYAALGMLQTGARGATRAQILTALQSSGLAPAGLDRGLAGLRDALITAARHDGLTLASADSLWQQRGLPLRPGFLRALARYYRAGVWQTDFGSGTGEAAINHWTAHATHGKIPRLFDHLDRSTVLVLANALYFHGAWKTAFDPHESRPGSFTTAAGGTVEATFMHGGPGMVRTAATDRYRAAELPYRGGRFAAMAIMPTRTSLARYIRSVTPGQLDDAVHALRRRPVAVALPRFTTRSSTDLAPVLQRLGMRDAFTGRADFGAMSPADLQVDQVRQRVYLGVGEKGTTAAAATGVGVAESLAVPRPSTLVFDHPFLFLVRDTTTGAVLFASAVNNPKAG